MRCGARCTSRPASSSAFSTPTPPTRPTRTCADCSDRCSPTPEVMLVKGAFDRPLVNPRGRAAARGRAGHGVDGAAGAEPARAAARRLRAAACRRVRGPSRAVRAASLPGRLRRRDRPADRCPAPVGLDALAESRLGTRQNRHQSLRALGAMAYAVLVAVERRIGPARSVARRALPAAMGGRRDCPRADRRTSATGRRRVRPRCISLWHTARRRLRAAEWWRLVYARHGRRRREGDDRNRTGVNGFAGRCVTTPPRRRERQASDWRPAARLRLPGD